MPQSEAERERREAEGDQDEQAVAEKDSSFMNGMLNAMAWVSNGRRTAVRCDRERRPVELTIRLHPLPKRVQTPTVTAFGLMTLCLLDADVLPVHRLHPIDVTGNVDGARLGRFGCRVSGQRDDAVLGVHVDVSVVEFGVGREG